MTDSGIRLYVLKEGTVVKADEDVLGRDLTRVMKVKAVDEYTYVL